MYTNNVTEMLQIKNLMKHSSWKAV